MRYFRPNFFYLSFQFVWVSKILVKSVFIHFLFYFVPWVVVKRITIWGWLGWGDFPFKKSWTILAQRDGALSWIEVQMLIFIIRLTLGRSTFSKCFLFVLQLTFKPSSFTWNDSEAPFYVTRVETTTFYLNSLWLSSNFELL